VKKNKPYWQQGDVLFKMAELPKETPEKEIKDGIVAKGEATGHAHRVLLAPPIKLFLIKTALYLVALDGCVVVHDTHGAITLPPGTYQVSKVREYDHFLEETREVAD
jgi:hypothetical protein